ncbi:ABC transporter substrate-binding protein, partial [Brucella abortus]
MIEIKNRREGNMSKKIKTMTVLAAVLLDGGALAAKVD